MVAVHPGEMLTEWQTEHGMTSADLARRLGVTTKHVSEFRNGKTGMSPKLARSLELVTGISAATWLGMQAAWQIAQLTGEEC